MVDFNNETTVTRPAADLVKVLILEHRENVIAAFEFYHKKDATGIRMDTSLIQARLFCLFLELQASLKRRDQTSYDLIHSLVLSKKYDDLISAFFYINEELDKLKLTVIDTRENLGGNIVDRNRKQGAPV